MNAITPNYMFQDKTALDNESVNHRSAQQLRMNAMQKESQDITLTTEEGDKVTISLLSQTKVDYMAFDYSDSLKGKSSSLAMEKLNASTGSSMQMTVEGDLNEAERADINKVLGQLDSIMQDLISGDLDQVMSKAMGILDGTETVSGLEAILQFQQQVSVEQRSMTRMTGNSGQMPPPPPPSQMPPPPPQGNRFVGSSIIAEISAKMMDTISNSKVELSDLTKSIKELFANIFDQFSLEDPKDQLKSEFMKQLESQLLTQLPAEEEPATEGDATPATL